MSRSEYESCSGGIFEHFVVIHNGIVDGRRLKDRLIWAIFIILNMPYFDMNHKLHKARKYIIYFKNEMNGLCAHIAHIG